MYKKRSLLDSFNNTTTEYIFKTNYDNSVTSFANIESNDSYEYKQYLEWVAEGNEAEEWVAE